MTSKIFTQNIKVSAEDIDNRNHVNNVVYLQWCLDVAQAHWEAQATKTIKENFFWYVLNHTIDYRAAAVEGETLELKTWVVSAKGTRSERRYEIWRPSDKKLLVETKSVWCLLNAKTLRPARITDEILNIILPDSIS